MAMLKYLKYWRRTEHRPLTMQEIISAPFLKIRWQGVDICLGRWPTIPVSCLITCSIQSMITEAAYNHVHY